MTEIWVEVSFDRSFGDDQQEGSWRAGPLARQDEELVSSKYAIWLMRRAGAANFDARALFWSKFQRATSFRFWPTFKNRVHELQDRTTYQAQIGA